MSFEIRFDYEVEQLGIVLKVWAEYENSGGGSDEPPYGPECTSITATIIDENDANDEDIFDGLADLFTSMPVPYMAWVLGSDGWHVEATHSGMRVTAQASLMPPKANPKKWELHENGTQKVYRFVSLQELVQEAADEKACEAEMDGAGGPDPDEAFEAARDDELMRG